MKKIIVLMIVILIGIVFWIKITPPLEYGTIAGNGEYTSVVIGLGNTGFNDIQVTEVYVNNGETPSQVKMQIEHPDKGFIVTDDFSSSEAATHNFFSLMDTKIKKGTIIGEIYERQDKKQVHEDDRIYGLTILNEQPISKVTIQYRYLGMPYKIEVQVK
ncbi:hypothetical protein DCE79_11270 [Lysinibacillus sp. 2017]|uniref:hypothetical protein n=1 Tax=unclassified Lysinibacillus TaxID=2636778 RepID=UPI000D5273CB|nr:MULTISPECIES: hypothetical protein [unclassified Lysinibacillus]AWE07931.1 hypothetical protein DCE79_11270 [Lysinibacillus sp. 2017]TGN31603.1 hypothetical protein E4L99_16690 [Lysinibacillus sp. S2017]